MHHHSQEPSSVARPDAFTASIVIDPDIHMPPPTGRHSLVVRLLHRVPGLRWLAS
ncbi:hypothetical protein [Agromyces italicus]|uniref:hypothetical protein n=1 Tax=Agromyces italicus TaxID=279572 RepID=UPI0003B6CAFE|nr:hypothetical protein [Agromyces italicus]